MLAARRDRLRRAEDALAVGQLALPADLELTAQEVVAAARTARTVLPALAAPLVAELPTGAPDALAVQARWLFAESFVRQGYNTGAAALAALSPRMASTRRAHGPCRRSQQVFRAVRAQGGVVPALRGVEVAGLRGQVAQVQLHGPEIRSARPPLAARSKAVRCR